MKFLILFIFSFIVYGCQSDIDITVIDAVTDDSTKEVVSSSNCIVSLELLSTLPNATGSNGQASFILGSFGFASSEGGTEVLQIVDFSDEGNVVNRGSYDPSGHGFLDLYAEGSVVYGSSINGELHSVDVSDPDNPTTLDILSITNQNWGMVSKGDYLYIGNYGSGLNVIDKSDPTNLISVNVITGYSLMHMQIEGNILYGTTGRKIVIMDISAPRVPSLIGELDLGASWMAYEFHKAGDYLYAVSKPQKQIQVIDVTNSATPTLVYTSPVDAGGNDFRSIAGTDDKIFIGTGSGSSGEVLAYDIKENPMEPSLDDSIVASNRAYEIYLKDNYIFTANRGGQADLFKYSCD